LAESESHHYPRSEERPRCPHWARECYSRAPAPRPPGSPGPARRTNPRLVRGPPRPVGRGIAGNAVPACPTPLFPPVSPRRRALPTHRLPRGVARRFSPFPSHLAGLLPVLCFGASPLEKEAYFRALPTVPRPPICLRATPPHGLPVPRALHSPALFLSPHVWHGLNMLLVGQQC